MQSNLEGRKFWKVGDRRHVWVVDAVEPESEGRPPFAILVSEDGLTSEDVDISHLLNEENYLPTSEA